MTNPIYLLAAIGLALFASLLAAWIVGRRKRKPIRRVFTAGTEQARHVWDGQQMWVRVGVNKWQQHAATPETLGGDEWTDVAREFILAQFDASFDASFEASERTGQTRPATPAAGAGGSACPSRVAASPYASSITGTGSRPEAPWVTREELDAAEQRVNDGLDDLAARLDALESKCDGEARAPAVAGLTEDQWNTPPRLVLGESKRGGEGWRVFRRIGCGSVGVETEDGAAYLYDAQNWWVLLSGKGGLWFSSLKDSYTELHGPERARVVREFSEWRASQ